MKRNRENFGWQLNANAKILLVMGTILAVILTLVAFQRSYVRTLKDFSPVSSASNIVKTPDFILRQQDEGKQFTFNEYKRAEIEKNLEERKQLVLEKLEKNPDDVSSKKRILYLQKMRDFVDEH